MSARRLLSVVVCLVIVAPAFGQGVITDGNATWAYTSPVTPGLADYEPDSGGAPDDQMVQNWWWYRITSGPGTAPFESPLSWPPSSQTYVGNTAILSQSEPFFDWELEVILDDDPMVGTAIVSETLTVENTSGLPIEITIFNYADFQVGGDNLDDFAVALGSGHVGFIDDNPNFTAELDGVSAGGYIVGDASTVLGSLNDGTTTTTDPMIPSGPGDLAAAVQYQMSVSPGGMISVAELLPVAFFPEPATVALLLMGAAAISRRRRGHQ